MKRRLLAAAFALMGLAAGAGNALADGSGDPAPVKDENGKYFDTAGNPTFKVKGDSVDWYTYSGYRRYHSECHV